MDKHGDNKRVLRWGIVSAGLIANDFCLALRTLPADEHQLVAVAARSLEKAKQFAERHGVKSAYGSYESIAQDPDVDVAYIATIHPAHVPLSMMMLAAGKHVLCEKPMSLTTAGAKKVLDFAQQKQLFFVEGFWSRYFPAYDQLRRELSSGSIGEVKGLEASFGVAFDRNQTPRFFSKELGGGVVRELGVYPIQLACLVFRNEKPEKICVNGHLLDNGEDMSADIMLCYKDGRTAHIIARGDCWLPNSAVIWGTKGRLEIPLPFWAPTRLKTPTQDYEFDELPKTSEPTVLINSAGFVYEINAIRSAILQGELQVSQITHCDSLLISEIADEILRQLGVHYDAE